MRYAPGPVEQEIPDRSALFDFFFFFQQVQDCIVAMGELYVLTAETPTTFVALLRQVQGLRPPDPMEVSCNMVNIVPVEGEPSNMEVEK